MKAVTWQIANHYPEIWHTSFPVSRLELALIIYSPNRTAYISSLIAQNSPDRVNGVREASSKDNQIKVALTNVVKNRLFSAKLSI